MAKKLLFLFFTFFTLNIYAQNVTMTGTVVDVENLPLIGVNVIIKGSTVGTFVDENGIAIMKISQDYIVPHLVK